MKIIESISNGMLKLSNTKDKYKEMYDLCIEKKESFQIMVELTEVENNRKLQNLEKKVEAIKTRIQYIDFILNELKGIKNFVEIEEKTDFTNHCIYFGSGTLYYSTKFLNLTNLEIFETILNHIFFYTGSLYIINNKDIRMSYILTAFGICYGEQINFKDGKDIYKKYSNRINCKVLDINKNYRNFIMRNYKFVNFFNHISSSDKEIINMTYRIIFGNVIKLQNMRIKIENNMFSISEINKNLYFFSRYSDDKFFKLI